jgi:hypothetical protein
MKEYLIAIPGFILLIVILILIYKVSIKSYVNLSQEEQYYILMEKYWFSNCQIVINDSLAHYCGLRSVDGEPIINQFRQKEVILEKLSGNDTVYLWSIDGTLINKYIYPDDDESDKW